MAINKKRDFKKLSVCIQEFLSRLPCDETTGFLRDTLYLSLLELHKYYVKVKDQLSSSLSHSNGIETLTDVFKAVSQVSNGVDKYQSRWYGYNDGSNETESQGFLAAHQGDIENVKHFVHSDDADPFGQTYLMYTVQHGGSHQVECIQYILSLNFDINSQSNDGTTALHVACQYDQKQAIHELLKNKADPTIQDNKGRAPLHWTAISSSTEITKLLLQYGADINVKDCNAMTPMMWACHFNKSKNMHVLKNAYERIDPTTEGIFHDRDDNGRTVLHWAVPMANKYGLHCLKDLLRSDVSHIRDNQKRTVLHTAAKEGSVSACKLILTVCGKEMLHMKDNQNETALHLATLCGHGETVDYLLQFGANISNENNCGRTALQEAAFGHYHYCLLVFAAFEQMKSREDHKPVGKIQHEDIQEVEDKRAKRYESWVIPTGFLHNSQEIPDITAINGCTESQVLQAPAAPNTDSEESKEPQLAEEVPVMNEVDLHRQLVDVSEIKGFEVNEDSLNNTRQNNQTKNNKESVPHLKSNQTTLQRSKRVEEERKEEMVHSGKDQDISKGRVQDELLQYSSQYVQQHGSALTSTASSEPENESISENIEVSSLGNDTDDEQECRDSDKEIPEEKDFKSQAKTDTSVETKNERLHFPESKLHRGNLAPIKNHLTQPSFGIPSKLDPIPLHIPNKKGFNSKGSENAAVPPRGIVAPLQPPPVAHQKDPSQSTFQEIRPPSNTSNGSFYGTRGPGHGPLAQANGKSLLNHVFQDPSNIQEQKTPETQRRITNKNNRSGRLPHPPRC